MTPRYSIIDFGYPESDPLHYGIQRTNHQRDKFGSDTDSEHQHRAASASAAALAGSDDSDYDEDEEESINQKAIALYSFDPENDNELKLQENQIILISYRYGQGWLVAHDPNTGETGLIPEEYVELYSDEDDEEEYDIQHENEHLALQQQHEQQNTDISQKQHTEEARPFLPQLLQDHTVEGNESDWVDDEDDADTDNRTKKAVA